MLRVFFLLVLFVQASTVVIESPKQGDILRGQVEVSGNMDVPNFVSAELAFAFASDSADHWFAIQTFPQSVTNSPFAIWDTTSVTDGDYKLRLRVYLQDGSFQDFIVTDIKIGNNILLTATPTEKPLNFQPTSPPLLLTEATVAPTQSFPQPTPLPANPASLTVPLIYSTFARGALITLVIFLLVSLLLRLRKN